MQLLVDIEEKSASGKMSVVQVPASITEALPNDAPNLESEKEFFQSLRAAENFPKNTSEEDNDRAKIEGKGDINNVSKDDAAKVDEKNKAKINQDVIAGEEDRSDYIDKMNEAPTNTVEKEEEDKLDGENELDGENKLDSTKVDANNEVEVDRDGKSDKEVKSDAAKVEETRKSGDKSKIEEGNKSDAAKSDENNEVEMDQDAEADNKADKYVKADVAKVDERRKVGDKAKIEEEDKLDAAEVDENNEVEMDQDAKACGEVKADVVKADETRSTDGKAKIEEECKLDGENKLVAVQMDENNDVNIDQDANEDKKVKEATIAEMDEPTITDDTFELEEESNLNRVNKLIGENHLDEEVQVDKENKLCKETTVEEETLMDVEDNLEDETKVETEANMDKETELDGETKMDEDINMNEEHYSESSQGISKISDKTENYCEKSVVQENITNDDTKDQEHNISNIDDPIDEDELLKEPLDIAELNNENNTEEIREITTTNDYDKNSKEAVELEKGVEPMDKDILKDSYELEEKTESVDPAKTKSNEAIVNGNINVEPAKLDVDTSKQAKESDDSSRGTETKKPSDKSGDADTEDLKNEPDLDDFINSTDVQKDPTLENLELGDIINENATTNNVCDKPKSPAKTPFSKQVVEETTDKEKDVNHSPKSPAKTPFSKQVVEETTVKEKDVNHSEENTVVLTGTSTTDVSPKETDKLDNDKVQNSEPANKPTNATQDISSDDEIESSCSAVPNAVNSKKTVNSSDKPVQSKECVSLVDDDDDIMLIDEDTNPKTDKTSDETPKETGAVKTAASFKESSSDDDVVISSDVCEKVSATPDKELSSKEADKTTKEDTIDESKTKAGKIEDGPLVAINFLNSFKTKMGDMTRADLEEFCILKIVEGVVDRSNLSEIKGKLKTMMQNVEEWRKKVMVLNKQNRDLQIVLRTVQEEQKKRSDEVITPLKITRSVGMQVLMTENKVDGTHRTRGQKRSFTNVNPPPLKNIPAKVASQLTKNLKTPIPVPRLVPALNSSPGKGGTVRVSPQLQNSTVTSNSGAGKAATPNGVKAYAAKPAEKRTYSVSIDLTDDEPPAAKQMATGKGLQPPVRLVPSQQLMAPGHRASLLNHNTKNSNPRQVYIPIGGQQGNIRPGQTVVFKNSPNVRARQPNPGTVVRPVRAPVARNQNKHPAPLPQVFSQQPQPPNWKALPPAPDLKISKIENGIVVSWKIDGYQEDSFEEIVSYQLFAYQETSAPASTFLWNKIGDIKALPLPMACTLTQFIAGYKYYFAVRAVDIKSRIGPFSLPGSILLLNK